MNTNMCNTKHVFTEMPKPQKVLSGMRPDPNPDKSGNPGLPLVVDIAAVAEVCMQSPNTV